MILKSIFDAGTKLDIFWIYGDAKHRSIRNEQYVNGLLFKSISAAMRFQLNKSKMLSKKISIWKSIMDVRETCRIIHLSFDCEMWVTPLGVRVVLIFDFYVTRICFRCQNKYGIWCEMNANDMTCLTKKLVGNFSFSNVKKRIEWPTH